MLANNNFGFHSNSLVASEGPIPQWKDKQLSLANPLHRECSTHGLGDSRVPIPGTPAGAEGDVTLCPLPELPAC